MKRLIALLIILLVIGFFGCSQKAAEKTPVASNNNAQTATTTTTNNNAQQPQTTTTNNNAQQPQTTTTVAGSDSIDSSEVDALINESQAISSDDLNNGINPITVDENTFN